MFEFRMMPMMQVIQSVWIGPEMHPFSNACINSFLDHGHEFHLYTFEAVKNVPAGTIILEAERIIPQKSIFQAHGGFETYTDLFGATVLWELGGWWVDLDVVCLENELPRQEIVYAEEKKGLINNGVLRFPAKSPVILDLLEYIRLVDPVSSPWGSTGPLALTKIFRRHSIESYQIDTKQIYPLHWRETPKLLFPEFCAEVESRLSGSCFAHLWGSTLREIVDDFKHYKPIGGSYLDKIYTRHLDSDIKSCLEPQDEPALRRRIQSYIKEEWGDEIKLV